MSLFCILESFLLNIIGEHKNVLYFVLWVSILPKSINYLSLKLSVAICLWTWAHTRMLASYCAFSCVLLQLPAVIDTNKFMSLSSEILWKMWQVWRIWMLLQSHGYMSTGMRWWAWMFRWWRSDPSDVLGRYERQGEPWMLYFELQVPFSLVNKATVEPIQQHLVCHSYPLIRPVHRTGCWSLSQGPVIYQ